MAKFSLDEILDNDPLGLLEDVKAKNPILTADDRLLSSFEEINSFVELYGRKPLKSHDMNERKLHSRLEGLRADSKKVEMLQKYDRFNLLVVDILPNSSEVMASASPMVGVNSPLPTLVEEIVLESIDDILNDDILGIFEDEVEDIFTLKNVPKKTTMPDYVASRKSCKDFDRFEELFKRCQSDLRTGKRQLIKFQNEQQIRKGYYFVLKGVLLYVEDIGETIKSKGKKNARLRLIFENATESDMLLRSLSAELYKNGKRVTEYDETKLEGMYKMIDEDKQSGFIYVLKSKSSDERISTKKNLYKIGFAKEDVNRRVANAINEPTYLMASVSIVSVYQCFNMNPQKLEQLLHKFFGKSCLDIEIFDKNGNKHHPREWFIAPLEVIDEAIELIISARIINYVYDFENESIAKRKE